MLQGGKRKREGYSEIDLECGRKRTGESNSQGERERERDEKGLIKKMKLTRMFEREEKHFHDIELV